MQDLSVRSRLLTAFALVTLMLMIPQLVAYNGINELEKRLTQPDASAPALGQPRGSQYLPAELSATETAKRIKLLLLATSVIAFLTSGLIAMATTRALTRALTSIADNPAPLEGEQHGGNRKGPP
ncbi:MAG: hypothetical protein GVY22_14115 [Gammaproteobacteria bacterium]|jgi:hypothetical protein|nr:hypothetical protein [Gammaproteobacteria bacterium]